MHYSDARLAVDSVRGDSPFPYTMNFVSPILSAVLAAEALRNSRAADIKFGGDAELYAGFNGLREALAGDYETPTRTGLCGSRYSKLTKLAHAAEVDHCNGIVADVLYEQLGKDNHHANELAKVVGELHDNVASHADGAGFSSAQVYLAGSSGARVEFGIADIGRGILSNAKRADPTISTDREAIKWALQKGTTTASFDPWAQRLPDDATSSPYPDDVPIRTGENHHLGLGLYELVKMVEQLEGGLWIWSGVHQLYLGHGQTHCKTGRAWQGVAIEFEARLPKKVAKPKEVGSIELRRRLGL